MGSAPLRLHSDSTYFGRGATVLVTDVHGRLRGARHGLWVDETRVLSRYEGTVDGRAPEPAGASVVGTDGWLGYFIARVPGTGGGQSSQQALELRLSRTIAGSLRERIEVTNYSQCNARFRLELSVDADFADLEEAEGPRKQHGRVGWRWNGGENGRSTLRVRYEAEHAYDHQGVQGIARIDRCAELRVECRGCKPTFRYRRIGFEIDLAPHATWTASMTWKAGIDRELPAIGEEPLGRRFEMQDGPEGPLVHVVVETLERARRDLDALRLLDADGRPTSTFAGGWPTFTAFFGRDALAASWQAAMLGPEMMHAALSALASSQATSTDDWRDEQPGRMLHEHHTGPLAALQYGPHERYYGDVTTSIYYPVVVASLWHWTGDRELVRPFVGPARDALAWADRCALGPHGFYEYRTRSEQGEKNQGWKDSDDAIVYEDGSQVRDPLGTCEMQAFVYAAKVAMSELLFWLGDLDDSRAYFEQARDLKRRFNERFWMQDERYVAMAIDHDGRLARSIASDPGHCVAAGIVDDDRVPAVAARMMSPDLFSGWGVRTLAASHPAYDPFAYHRGTVWPVENAVFALGFARYGLHAHVHTLCKAQFEAASLFDGCRLPETFGGHPRDDEHPFPGLYPKANWPQAWSASAPFAMLEALLGIVPYAPLHALLLDPHLPAWLPSVIVRNVRVGDASVDLRFVRGLSGRTHYEVLRREGLIHVLRQPSPQSLTAGWGERFRDAVATLLHAA